IARRTKKRTENGRLRYPRKARQDLSLLVAEQAREERRLAFTQAQLRADLPGAERRHILTCHADAGPERAALDGERVEHNLTFVAHSWRPLEVDADVLVVEGRLGNARQSTRHLCAKHRGQHRNLVA